MSIPKQIVWSCLFVAVVAITAFLPGPVALADELRVEDAATVKAVENFMVEGVGETFSASVSRIYAFTRIVGATKDTFIYHQWYYGDRLMAEIKLEVDSPNWRTFSSKRILPQWTGAWHVDVVDASGKRLYRLQFWVE